MLATCVALLLASAQGAVIGIDLGSRFLKVGIIQPGTGIELVLNEATKRKSSSVAGFNAEEERIYGDESYNLLGKLPEKQFLFSKMLLGKQLDSPEVKLLKELGYPYEFLEDEESKGALYKYGSNATYKPEEAVAFVLSYAKQIAEAHAGSVIKDCVITVPPFWRHEERTAMLAAAQIAGLNVLSLMHDSTAFAFKYGFDNEAKFAKEKEATNVVFYDLGATSYKVSLVSFASVAGKKNKTTGTMTVRGVAWDQTLGGWLFDQIVLDLLVEQFKQKHPKVKPPIDQSPKAMGKLRKEAERVKDILSANTMYKVGIQALHMDRDLMCVVNRADMEERAEKLGYWARLKGPIEEVLAQANLTKADIHRVEVVGGATRILRVKEAAKQFFEREQLDGSLNGDEAAAFGATLYAAKQSTSFRLREFTITDAYPHAIGIRMGTEDAAEEAEAEAEEGAKKSKDKLLFKANTKFPHKKLITMSRGEDLLVSLGYREADGTSTADPIASFNISGVSAAVERLSKDPKKTALGKPKLSVTFALSPSGLLEVSKSELALEMLETYDDYELVPANQTDEEKEEEEKGAGEEKGEAKDEAAAAAEELAKAADAEGNATAANATANGSNATKMTRVKVEKERKRVHYTTLKAEVTPYGKTLPMSEGLVKAAIQRNAKLLEAERTRAYNAEAKNMLEAFIIETRSKVSSDEDVEKVSQEEERTTIAAEFEASEDWLYEEGKDLVAADYQKKKRELEKLTSPIFLRLTELEARPRVVKHANEAINWTKTMLETWVTERPEVTEEEREKLTGLCANFTEWLEEVEAKQAELPLYEAPAYLSSQVTTKLDPIEKEMRRLLRKPKPKPPKVKANSTNATKANGTAAANDTTTATEDAPSTPDAPDAAAADAEPAADASAEKPADKDEV